jgi:hypothetical protein
MEKKGESLGKRFILSKLFHRRSKFEFLLLLALGIMVGMAVKWNASSRVTMGYEDYLVEKNVQSFQYKALAQKVAEENGGVAGVATGGSAGSCGL